MLFVSGKRFEEQIADIEQKFNTALESKNTQIKELNDQITKLRKDLNMLLDIRTDSARMNVDIDKEIITPKETTQEPKLDDEQRKIFNEMETTNNSLFITGRAGTGKSFLLKTFKNLSQKRVMYTAPTGVAAINIGGVTLHKAFNFNNFVQTEDGEMTTKIHLNTNMQKALQNTEMLVIDEISMVRVDILEQISKIFQKVMRNDIPFGGKQIVLFGDPFQLPPVAKENEIKYLTKTFGGIFFFNSPSFKKYDIHYHELTINHRQLLDPRFNTALNNIREGLILPADLELLNTRYNIEIPDRVTRLFPRRYQVEHMNKEKLAQLETKMHTFRAIVEKDSEKTQYNETDFPCEFVLELKQGATVMMINNDKGNRWANGTLGIISALENDTVKVMINKIEYEINREAFCKYDIKYDVETNKLNYVPIVTVKQFPIILAWAMTIHKSQGATYQRIAIDLTQNFAEGQAYVALSRCVSLDGLFLENKVLSGQITNNNSVMDFNRTVKERSLKVSS